MTTMLEARLGISTGLELPYNPLPMNQDQPTKIVCRHLWKVFGPEPERVMSELLAADASKSDLLTRTRHVLAVKDVSFDVKQGETFVVMGLSGSGKSTLIRCLSRLVEPTAGDIFIDGEDIRAMTPKELRQVRRRKIGMVFQHFGLFPHRRIIDNVAYGLEVQNVERAARYRRAQEVIEVVGLMGWEQHYPGELSGGMQQRVGLARALAVDPEILFFDEPFSALDPLIRREMQDELQRLQTALHKTIVFITHDFHEAIKLGDHIAIMKDGEIVQMGTPQHVVLHPANAYVREFTEDVPASAVVTAGAIMRPPLDGDAADLLPAVNPQANLLTLVSLAAEHETRIAVRNGGGELLGIVDDRSLMRALAGLGAS